LGSDKAFYDRKYDVRSHYTHAAAFVRDIVEEHGKELFKEFCRRISNRRERELFFGNEGSQLSEAFRETYGVSLTEWERAWKARWNKTTAEKMDLLDN